MDLNFLIRKIGLIAASMLVVSVIVFLALELNVENLAVKVLGQFSTESQRQLWLEENGYFRPVYIRYFEWLGNFVTGDWGESTRYRVPVREIVLKRLENTSRLAFSSMLIIFPVSILFGIIAGVRKNTITDRTISFVGILFTSIPEFVSAIILTYFFSLSWELLPGTSVGGGFESLILPVTVLSLYSIGYLLRLTRASFIEVMASHYVQVAYYKGLSTFQVVVKHALRNALIVPITVVFLLFPWLLSGVVVVEYFFAYKGFGTLLLEASLNEDIFVIEACAMISVILVVLTQILSELCYAFLNPRIRLKRKAEE